MIKSKLDSELKKIVDISKEFGAKMVILFGSCLEDIAQARDIDIAISGVSDQDFFKYYGRISMAVEDEVDLVDLKDLPEHFYHRIVSRGKVLYERKD